MGTVDDDNDDEEEGPLVVGMARRRSARMDAATAGLSGAMSWARKRRRVWGMVWLDGRLLGKEERKNI